MTAPQPATQPDPDTIEPQAPPERPDAPSPEEAPDYAPNEAPPERPDIDRPDPGIPETPPRGSLWNLMTPH